MNLFGKKKKTNNNVPGRNSSPAVLDKSFYETVLNRNYPGLQMFARDVNLNPKLAAKYIPGMIIREKAYTDCSSRFMGMATTHRYVILSNHMANLTAFEQGTNWGLHTSKRDSRFKVLGIATYEGRTGIFLLHLPDDDTWKVYKNCIFSIDNEIYSHALSRFREKCVMDPVPELMTNSWLARCMFPLGMNDFGEFWTLE